MDIIAHVDYDFLGASRNSPGPCISWSTPRSKRSCGSSRLFRTVPGGSAANTARGFAWLASAAGRRSCESFPRLGAQRRRPPSGPGFQRRRRPRCHRRPVRRPDGGRGRGRLASCAKTTPTGTSVILVTPDGERTMNTFLGACRDFEPLTLTSRGSPASRILYLTGYLWDTENQRQAAVQKRPRWPVGPAGTRWWPSTWRIHSPCRGTRDAVPRMDSRRTSTSCSETGTSSPFSRDRAATRTACRRRLRWLPLVVMKVGEKGCLVGLARDAGRGVPGVPVRARGHHRRRRRVRGGLSLRSCCRARSPSSRRGWPTPSRRTSWAVKGAITGPGRRPGVVAADRRYYGAGARPRKAVCSSSSSSIR